MLNRLSSSKICVAVNAVRFLRFRLSGLDAAAAAAAAANAAADGVVVVGI